MSIEGQLDEVAVVNEPLASLRRAPRAASDLWCAWLRRRSVRRFSSQDVTSSPDSAATEGTKASLPERRARVNPFAESSRRGTTGRSWRSRVPHRARGHQRWGPGRSRGRPGPRVDHAHCFAAANRAPSTQQTSQVFRCQAAITGNRERYSGVASTAVQTLPAARSHTCLNIESRGPATYQRVRSAAHRTVWTRLDPRWRSSYGSFSHTALKGWPPSVVAGDRLRSVVSLLAAPSRR